LEGIHRPGLSSYLLENGNLLRTVFIGNSRFVGGGSVGLIQEFDSRDLTPGDPIELCPTSIEEFNSDLIPK